MTRSQDTTLSRVKNAIPRFDFYSEDYEIKQLEITQCGSMLHCSLSTEPKGAGPGSLTCKHRSFFIGERGAILVLNSNYHLVYTTVFDLMNKYFDY